MPTYKKTDLRVDGTDDCGSLDVCDFRFLRELIAGEANG